MKNIIILILFFISFDAYSQKTKITGIKLKNGYTVIGNIIDSIPNKSYTIKTLKGVEMSYSMDEIDSLDEIEKISKITGRISTNELLEKVEVIVPIIILVTLLLI